MTPGKDDKSSQPPAHNPKRRGNPNFTPGHKAGGRPKGCKNKVIKLERCATFMERFGWKELEFHAMNRNSSKVALGALNTIAAYAYGRPSEFVDLTTDGQPLGAPTADPSLLDNIQPAALGALIKRLEKEIQ